MIIQIVTIISNVCWGIVSNTCLFKVSQIFGNFYFFLSMLLWCFHLFPTTFVCWDLTVFPGKVTESTVHLTFEMASNIWTTYHRMSCENVLFLPRFLFLCRVFVSLKQHVRVLCVLVAELINYHPNFSAFFQINPNRWERRHEKRHCCVADVMCSGSFGQPLLGWGALSFRKPTGLPFPSAWSSYCRGSPNNGIPLVLDANTLYLLDAGLQDVCCDHFDRWENTYTTHRAEDGLFLPFFEILAVFPVPRLHAEEKAPSIVHHPSDVVVKPGNPAQLSCRAEGSPQVSLEWLQNGQPLQMSKADGQMQPIMLPEGSLFFLSVGEGRRGPSHEGVYTCVARNAVGIAISRNASLHIAGTLRSTLLTVTRHSSRQPGVCGDFAPMSRFF